MARPVFEPQIEGPFGGSEVRAYLFATGLARLGADVHILVDTHNPPPVHTIDRVTLHYRRLPAPLPRLRYETNWRRKAIRWPGVAARRMTRSITKRCRQKGADGAQYVSRLSQINADVLVTFGVHHHSATLVQTAGRLGIPSILMIASDTDLAHEYCKSSTWRNAYGQRADICFSALQNATAIVVQSHEQQRKLKERFGRRGTCIHNPIPLHPHPSSRTAEAIDVLWIGRGDCFSKRADIALAVAAACPTLRFTFVMNPRDEHVFRRLLRDVPHNATVLRQVAWREIDDYFRSAKMLLNTSEAEGFPNTFLQAARCRLPIVSMNVDPNGMLSQHGAGLVVGRDVNSVAVQLEVLQKNSDLRRAMGERGLRYVTTFHEAAARCGELWQLIRELCVSQPVGKGEEAA